jgi:DNA-binding NarL/FixJ family response regulator
MTIRVLLVDDHQVVRQGLRGLLADDPRFEIVGEAANGSEGVALARTTKPDVVLMDVTMPMMDGIEATRLIKAESPNVKVVALSVRVDKPTLDSMLMAGASGFLSKDCQKDELTHAISSVASGNSYLSPEVARVFMSGYIEMAKEESKSPTSSLTSGELEVLKLIAAGKSTKEIADQLQVSVKTVEARRKNVMEKTGADSVAELVKLAIRAGLTELES